MLFQAVLHIFKRSYIFYFCLYFFIDFYFSEGIFI